MSGRKEIVKRFYDAYDEDLRLERMILTLAAE